VAAKFLPDRPRQAVEIWKRVGPANRAEGLKWVDRVGRPLPIQSREYRAAAEFCYHLALADHALAEQVVADAENEAMRFRQKGAAILALAETQPAEAREQLTSLLRDELPQIRTEDSLYPSLGSASAVAAWFLPLAEKVAPELCRELFWRALALRLPRPSRDDLGGEIEATDVELAKLLGRYDREIARALLEPLTAGASASDDGRGRTAERIPLFGLFSAAVYVDPLWAKRLLDAVGDSPSIFGAGDDVRLQFVGILALPPPERWDGDGAWPKDSSAGFWTPAARDKPLPP
jgi:hypothetical protein